MKVRPEDQAKIIGLLVAILAVAVWIIFFILPQLRATSGQASNPPSGSPTTTPVANGNVAQPNTQVQPVNSGDAPMQIASGAQVPEFPPIEPDTVVPTLSTKDPFKPVVNTRAPEATLTKEARPPVRPPNGGRVNTGNSAAVLPGGPFSGANGTVMPPAVVGPPPVPLIEVKGVVGDYAIIEVGGVKKFPRAGEVIADQVKVRRIHEDSIEVTVRGKNQTIGIGRTIGGETAPKTVPFGTPQQPLVNPSQPTSPNAQPMTSLVVREPKVAMQIASASTADKPAPRKRIRRRSRSYSSYRFSGRRL